MTAKAENYKGIEFVRISTLPEDQKQLIWTSIKHDKIIKILKSDCLLNDCIQVRDYEAWYFENYTAATSTKTVSIVHPKMESDYKLAFK